MKLRTALLLSLVIASASCTASPAAPDHMLPKDESQRKNFTMGSGNRSESGEPMETTGTLAGSGQANAAADSLDSRGTFTMGSGN